MNILLFSKSKDYTCKLLEWLNDNYTVVAVVCKDEAVLSNTEMEMICNKNNIRIIPNHLLYEMLRNGTLPKVDLAISNTYGRLIRKEFLDHVKGNCINIHGAILPDYRGLYAYNHGLLNKEREWGVTAHYVNEKFDDGEIIEITKFAIEPDVISVRELECETQKHGYELAKRLVRKWADVGSLPSYPQPSGGRYYSLEDFERQKEIKTSDSADMVRRKIHAFYCPPYEGAYIKIDGAKFELIDGTRKERL